jgi:di/tricarboxylate transporter
MTLEIWLTLSVISLCLMALMLTRYEPDQVLFGGVTVLLVLGVLSPSQALAGFANPGLIAVAVLYVVAAGLRETGALYGLVNRMFGRPKSVATAQARMMLPVTFMSAFLNNTPVVASFLPAVLDWAKKQNISPSKLMMPLSFAAIFGGTCTVIGTSTNLVIHGMLLNTGSAGFGFFELAWVGLPCAVVGIAYILIASRWLLPERIAAMEALSDPREYTVEMAVAPDGPLAGKTVEAAGLRHLPGLFLIEIERDGHLIAAPGPDEVLESDDTLVFAGITESIVDLQRIEGLMPATHQVFKLDAPRPMRTLVEVVVSRYASVAGRTIRDGRFRTSYGGVVIAVARHGQRVPGKIGDIRIQPGDTLLVEADLQFAARHRNSRDFLLVRPIDAEGVVFPRHERRWVSWVILLGVVTLAGTQVMDLVVAGMLGAGLMVATRCLDASTARRSLDLEILLVIGASLALGEAMRVSGTADLLANLGVGLAGDHPMVLLVAVYATTVVLTSVITNNAAAVLMFPLVLVAVQAGGYSPTPFVVALTVAASAGFATPLAYQTNLMIYGPGGYRFTDFLRFGLPLNLVIGVTAVLIIPQVWPLT